MEVAPHELAQLLKLAGIGGDPEPEVMSGPDMPDSEPEISVMAIPSDDGAPVDGGCGAPWDSTDPMLIISSASNEQHQQASSASGQQARLPPLRCAPDRR